MAWTAIVLYLVWISLAFGLRTAVQRRRTGDTGWRGVRGRVGSAEWFAGVLFGVALVIGVVGPVAELVGLGSLTDSQLLGEVGLGVAVVGMGLTIVAQGSMRDSWRIGVDASETTQLVVSGAFRIVRNPVFTAMVATAIGLALMVPNWVSLVGVVMLIVAVELQVRVVEEPYLRSRHGAAFGMFEARVGRFVPQVGRRREADTTADVSSVTSLPSSRSHGTADPR